jgi:hypothetical protein
MAGRGILHGPQARTLVAAGNALGGRSPLHTNALQGRARIENAAGLALGMVRPCRAQGYSRRRVLRALPVATMGPGLRPVTARLRRVV